MSVTVFPYRPAPSLERVHAAVAAAEGTVLPDDAEIHALISIHLYSKTEVDLAAAQWQAEDKLAAGPGWNSDGSVYGASHISGVDVLYIPRTSDVAPLAGTGAVA